MCVHSGTQNNNESYHHVASLCIRNRCPKTIFCGRTHVELAVMDAAIMFNDGERQRTKVFRDWVWNLDTTQSGACMSWMGQGSGMPESSVQQSHRHSDSDKPG